MVTEFLLKPYPRGTCLGSTHLLDSFSKKHGGKKEKMERGEVMKLMLILEPLDNLAVLDYLQATFEQPKETIGQIARHLPTKPNRERCLCFLFCLHSIDSL